MSDKLLLLESILRDPDLEGNRLVLESVAGYLHRATAHERLHADLVHIRKMLPGDDDARPLTLGDLVNEAAWAAQEEAPAAANDNRGQLQQG